MMTLELANALFSYEEETGHLLWKIDAGANGIGSRVGAVSGREGYTSYLQFRLFSRLYKVHRVIWLMKTGEWPEHHIDHIDGNGLNNKWSNLRPVTASQNMMNQKKRSDNTSGVKGVSYDRSRNKWYAFINAKKKRHMLGRYDSFDEAVIARQDAESRLHGQYARV